MIATLEHVVFIFTGWLQPRKSFALGTSCLRPLKIVMKRLRNSHPVNTFIQKKRTHTAPLHPAIVVGPFSKWGIDFIHCNPTLAEGHGYIIIARDYFTKWVEAMPTYAKDGNTAALFLFNHVIARFGVPQDIFHDHGSHF